jgi:hypothetical protein
VRSELSLFSVSVSLLPSFVNQVAHLFIHFRLLVMLSLPSFFTSRNLTSLQHQLQISHPSLPIPPINEHTFKLLQLHLPVLLTELQEATQNGIDDYRVHDTKTKFRFIRKTEDEQFAQTKAKLNETKQQLEKVIRQIQLKVKTQRVLAQQIKHTAHAFQVLTETEKVPQIKTYLSSHERFGPQLIA